MNDVVDIGAIFKRLAAEGKGEHQTIIGGVDVRLARVERDVTGRWDRHDDTTETVIVWSGNFDVAFREHTISVGAGQCCVVPVGVEHQGTSSNGAEVILFKSAPTYS
jgi:mannose-6-phosphate isomerase-like protein (cupin superfamily)